MKIIPVKSDSKQESVIRQGNDAIVNLNEREVLSEDIVSYEYDGVYIQDSFSSDEALITIAKIFLYKDYLNKTDFYYARLAETAEEVPEEVKLKRLEYRNFLKDL